MLAMEIAAALANGWDAMNGLGTVEKAVPVLFVDGEMHWDDLKQRNLILGINRGLLLSKMELERIGVEPTLNLADKRIRDWLFEGIIEQGVKLVIFDNVFSLVSGIDTNSDRDWSPINEWFLRLRSQNVSVILIHHVGKGREMSQLGTASRMFNVNWGLTLEPQKVESGEEPCSFTLRIVKKRGLMSNVAGRKFTLLSGGQWAVEEGFIVDDSKTQLERQRLERDCHIAKYLIEGWPYARIAGAVKVSGGTITSTKSRLLGAEAIKKKTVKQKTGFVQGPKIEEYFGAELYGHVFSGKEDED